MLSENSPSCRAKKGLSGSPHEPRNTAWHAISIHKLGLYPLNWLWRPPRAAELLGAACGGLLALISLREIKPSSPGLDPSNALRSCATHGQLDPTPWGPRALDPPVSPTLRWTRLPPRHLPRGAGGLGLPPGGLKRTFQTHLHTAPQTAKAASTPGHR